MPISTNQRAAGPRRAATALCASALTMFAAVATAPAQDASEAIIVLDASGSMWGQIEGKTKIEIARETLGGVLGSVPDNLSLGMIAYGHRRKGECSDIEEIVPVGSGTGPAIAEAANALSPKGKTPLSDAVRQAAERLRFTENKATVILITDGIETCNADPCAVANELERAGVDFTAHVVGFGLTEEEGDQVACLAENTGGLYLQAGDAGSLGEALTQTVAETAAPPPPPEPDPVPENIPDLMATLKGPGEIEQANRFTVTWDGPGDKFDRIEIYDPQGNNGEGDVIRRRQVRYGDLDARSVTLTAPATLGSYELRYWHAAGRKAIGTTPLEVIETSVSLSADESVSISRPIVVGWVGPGERYDEVQLFDAEAGNGEGKVLRNKRLRNDDFDNRKATMTAPAEPGEYQLRYWNGENKSVMATRPITVTDAEVAIDAPAEVEIGRTITAGWSGPGARYDELQFYDPSGSNGNGKVVRSKRLLNDDFDNNKVSMAAPAKPGDYEIRYWNGENKTVLATVPITVVDAAVSIDPPVGVTIGRTITAGWQGPGGRYDELQLYDPSASNGNGKVVRSKRLQNDDFDNNKVSMAAPAEPGEYELLYWNGENKMVLARVPITIGDADVSLSAAASVPADDRFEVMWVGPGGRYDEVQILNGAGKKVGSKRVRNDDYDGQTVTLKAPKEPGEYRLMYWNGENKAELATRPITVE